MGAKSNLVITKAGTHGLYRNWLKGAEPNFDLRVYAYDEAVLNTPEEGIDYHYLPAPKVVGWHRIFTEHADLLDRYERIALLDDDLDMDAELINRCFEMGVRHDLKLWQPSLSWDSYISFAGLLSNPAFELRHVSFIEMMCPFFTSDYLKACVPLFSLGFETGPDLIWSSLSGKGTRDFAVIDALVVHHTRPIGKQKHANGPATGDGYDDDNFACLKMFDMRWPPLISDRAILRNGRKIKSQALIALYVLPMIQRFWQAPSGTRLWGLNLWLRQLRHQSIRKLYFGNPAVITQKLAKTQNP